MPKVVEIVLEMTNSLDHRLMGHGTDQPGRKSRDPRPK